MKLLLCIKCSDIIALGRERRTCRCGSSSGVYLPDKVIAEVSGDRAVALGIDNDGLIEALKKLPEWRGSLGIEFNAFVLPLDCGTVRRKDKLKMSEK